MQRTRITLGVAVAALALWAASARAAPPEESAERQLARQFAVEAERLVRDRDTFQGAPTVAAVWAELGDAERAEAVFALGRGRKGLHHDISVRLLATGHARHGDLDTARRVIAQMRGENDGFQRQLAWIEVGEALVARGDRVAASEAFDEATTAIEAGPVDRQGIGLLGRIGSGRWANGEVDASARAFALALEKAPRAGTLTASCQREVGVRQAEIGNVTAARDTLARIADPASRDTARRHVAKPLFNAGRRDDAEQLINEIETPRQAQGAALEFAEWLVRAGEPERAKPWIARVEQAWPQINDPWRRVGLAFDVSRSHAAVGDRESAIQWLSRAAARADEPKGEEPGRGPPGEPEWLAQARRDGAWESYLREIAVAQAKLGLIPEARRMFARALAAARGREDEIWSKVAIWAVVGSQTEAGLPDDALQTMMALPRDDRDWPKLAKIGGALAKAGRLQEAIELCDRYHGHWELAKTLLAIGDPERALEVALRQKGGSGIYPLAEIARTLAANGREQVVVKALRGEMHDNQRLEILEGAMEALLSRDRLRAASKRADRP